MVEIVILDHYNDVY